MTVFGEFQNFWVSTEEKLADSLFKLYFELKGVVERSSARKFLGKKDLMGTYCNYEHSDVIPNYNLEEP